jgi:hypothetical protein
MNLELMLQGLIMAVLGPASACSSCAIVLAQHIKKPRKIIAIKYFCFSI